MKLHILEWHFVVTSPKHTCALVTLFCQHIANVTPVRLDYLLRVHKRSLEALTSNCEKWMQKPVIYAFSGLFVCMQVSVSHNRMKMRSFKLKAVLKFYFTPKSNNI